MQEYETGVSDCAKITANCSLEFLLKDSVT